MKISFRKINLEDKKTWRLVVVMLVCRGLVIAFLFARNNRYHFQIDYKGAYFDKWTGRAKEYDYFYR